MYDARYGTDWDHLDTWEILERAYALGVADGCGETNREEYDRLRDELGSYDESIVELSFREGRAEALSLRGDAADEEVWRRLVEAESSDDGTDELGALPGFESGALALVRQIQTARRGRRTDVPSFLRRE
ncbi:MAG: hypothetical protein ABEJ80_05735 [Halarchaeum sp.]